MKLVEGQIYKRKSLHDYFGGSRQSGISPSAKFPVIFIFSNDAGHEFGYEDGWTDDGLFLYTGDGQIGDMKFIRGNKAIRDHINDRKTIWLFTKTKNDKTMVKCHGELRLVDFSSFRTNDRDNNPRDAIRFKLEPISTEINRVSPGIRRREHSKPNRTERRGLITSRVGQGFYRQELIKRFGGKCAVTRSNVSEILIASHIISWSDSDDDQRLDVDNGILLSPVYDALFDAHLISFESDGLIVISKLLCEEDLYQLNVKQNAKIQVYPGMLPYLERHRNRLR